MRENSNKEYDTKGKDILFVHSTSVQTHFRV